MKEKSGKIIGLGLESSCDETSASVVVDGRKILSNRIYSQVELHCEYSGVVPEIASRAHLEKINTLIEMALDESRLKFSDLDYVAATNRPGLTGSLLIALQSAKAISFAMDIPLIGVNHLEAHLYAPFLEGNEPAYPFIGLLISGGNTALYRVNGPGEMVLIGKTVDDAVGEAFDKVSKYIGLGYPGGPLVESLARESALKKVFFPKIMTDPDDTRFSYSGLKTAVINHIKQNPDQNKADIVYSFQERALELLVRRLFTASRKSGINRMVVAGGVAANGRLRELIESERKNNEEVLIPSPLMCTDNAAMIAGISYQYYIRKIFDSYAIDVSAKP
ncbi:MAG: tRNA (adenosine(37)-N6)-threonylcarbamoyltransferase complex transferase subunit TsaD [Spirochaetae bacterium HGW-Spirochaetae-5]|nr:MAG: tRNA (adenosine(37)-N6)-threonylcarbamoyltransferase complex transferase subunit TsaD [Spirochaetae bacterium HGW-Spirochaetae-5]